MDESDQQNPFAAPKVDNVTSAAVTKPPELFKKFQQQIHALGAVWIILGLAVVCATVFGAVPGFRQSIPVISIGFLGLAILVVGVLALFKQMWAVYVGLILTYLFATSQLVTMNVVTLAILGVIIAQAHRVIGWAKTLQASGR